MFRVGSIIVTFNPDSSTIESINRMLEENVYLIVIDNGSQDSEYTKKIEEIVKKNKMFFYSYKTNKGLAMAQNKGIEIAKENQLEFIAFFDQDTILPVNFFNQMIVAFIEYEEKYNEKLGILAPNYLDRNTNEFARFAKLTKKGYEHKHCGDEIFMEVSFVISSGSLMRTSVVEKIGNYIDEFFIDQVDTEYSLRMLLNGYKIVVYSSIILNHTIGNRSKENIFGLTIKPNHHNEKRKYYIFRNGTKCLEWYGKDFKGFRILMVSRFIHDILGVTFFEKNKIKKITYMIKGMNSGRKPITKWQEV